MSVDWAHLPPELVDAIAKRLAIYADYLRFRAVCRAWRSAVPRIPDHLPSQLPWLMLPQSQAQSTRSQRAFFNLPDNRFHILNLPEASRRTRHCGSSHGWLVVLDDTPTILLLNPLTRAKIGLPPVTGFPSVVGFSYSEVGREYALRELGNNYALSLRHMRNFFIKKVVLSSSPLKGPEFVAVAILHRTNEVAYCKLGDQSWTIVEKLQFFCEDVMFVRGRVFYAVNKAGQIAVCDVAGNSPKVTFIETQSRAGGDVQYLASSGGELLLVTRYLNFVHFDAEPDTYPYLVYKTGRFKVFRLIESAPRPRWERVRSLGDRALFIGEYSSSLVTASGVSGFSGNCVYYTDDCLEAESEGYFGDYDLGIFRLFDESIETVPCYQRSFCDRVQWPPPLWISPNPC